MGGERGKVWGERGRNAQRWPGYGVVKGRRWKGMRPQRPKLAQSWCGEEGKSVGETRPRTQRWPGDGVVEGGMVRNAAATPKAGPVVVW